MTVIALSRIWETFVTLAALNVERLIALNLMNLTERDYYMMRHGTFVYGTLSPQQQEAFFEYFQMTYSSEVEFDATDDFIPDEWTMYLCVPTHIIFHPSTRQRTRILTDSGRF